MKIKLLNNKYKSLFAFITVVIVLSLFSCNGKKERLNWYEKSYYLLHIDHHTQKDWPVGRKADFDETLRILKLTNPDVIQIHAKGNPGYTTYPSKVGAVPDSLAKDVMRVWKNLADEMKIPFSAYYNLGRDRFIMETKPYFNRQRADGSLYDNILCHNSGVDTAYLFPMIKEIIEWYKPDGFWFDGFLWTVNNCYCDKCRNDFRKATNMDVPVSPESPGWAEYKELQREHTRDLIKRTCDFIHSIDPECLVCINYAYSLRQPEKPYEGIAYFSGDIGGNITKLSVLGKFYDTQGKPFDLMTPINERKGEYQKQEIAVITANGGRFFAWDSPTRETALIESKHKALAPVIEWMRERQEFTLNTERVADISLLHTAASHYENMKNSTECFGKAAVDIFSASEALTRRHLQHDIIADWRLTEGSLKTKKIVLENPSALVPEVVDALEKFVNEGGKLFITGTAPVSGGEKIRKMAGISQVSEKPEGAFLYGEEKHNVRVHNIVTAGAEVLLEYESAEGAKTPVLIHNKYEKGEVFYAPFACYSMNADTANTLPDKLLDELHNIVFKPEEISLTTDAPSDVEIVVRKKDTRTMIHLVNRAMGEEINAGIKTLIHTHRYNYINKDIPQRGNFTIWFKSGTKPLNVVAEPGNRHVDWSYENGSLRVNVPMIDIHQILVINI